MWILLALAGLSCTAFGPLGLEEQSVPGTALCSRRRRAPLRPEGPTWAALEARPVASALRGLDDAAADEPGEVEEVTGFPRFAAFASGLGVRARMTAYPVTSDFDMDARVVGATLYYHFKETEAARIEGYFSFLRDAVDGGENNSISFGADYVKYVGEAGFMHWVAGVGVIRETLYLDSYTGGCLRGAVGYRLGTGEKGVDLRAGMELPVGKGVNVQMALFFTVGYDL